MIRLFLLLINFYLTFQNTKFNSNLNTTNKKSKITCSVDKIKFNPKKIPSITKKGTKEKIKERKLDNDDEFQPIRIYLSTSSLENQLDTILPEEKDILEYLNNAKEYISKLIKVKPRGSNIIYSREDQNKLDILLRVIDQSLIIGVLYDLVIIPSISVYDKTITSEILGLDQDTNRPIIAQVNISVNLITDGDENKKFYIQSLLLHEFTHILGFLVNMFQYFPGGTQNVIKSEVSRGINRTYVITQKVKNLVMDYYDCTNIIGLELENQEDGVNPSSHWEARILLGEYMNLEQYTPEVVISDFTLALLEDSGWYKVNYYTGGLMRFGKHKGCGFLNNDCCDSNGNTKFKNEFFDKDDNGQPSCSSGRLSRTYCETKEYSSFPIDAFNRFRENGATNGVGGKTKNADYCFGFTNNDDEEQDSNTIYVGNCKYGKGNYGTRINYNSFPNSGNGELTDLKEKYSNNSFCVLSEAYPNDNSHRAKFGGVVHPMCYEMFCSEKTLAIKINDQYRICPREGGKVVITGNFTGHIYCPDYNLICTGTVMCNDMFDCINKNSTSITPDYDYEVTEDVSSQKIDNIKINYPIEGYELDDNGICPINCAECKDIKRCFNCRQRYTLIGEKEDDNKPIICDNHTDISTGYFQKNNVFYPCIKYCVYCQSSYSCITCDRFHILNSNRTICLDRIENCETYNEDITCRKCRNGFAFFKQDRLHCYNNLTEEKFFSIDGGISYYPCDTNISNCDICNNQSDRCSKCYNNFYFLENNRTFCFSNINLTNYYTNDNGISYILCNTTINHCDICKYENNELNCTFCEKQYYFIKENRKECFTGDDFSKFYTEDNGVSYYPCNTSFSQCEICNNNKSNCEKCFNGYYFIGDKKEKCEIISDFESYFTEDGITYYPCDTDIEGCQKCSSRNYCTLCKNNYYLVGGNRDKCHYITNIESFYLEDDFYFPCNFSLPLCNKCYNNKNRCSECNPNYYFIEDDRRVCHYGEDLRKYYTTDNGISYYLCSNAIRNCDECYDRNTCNLCLPSFYLKFEEPNTCYPESYFDNTYYRLNATHYKLCRDNINNCHYCSSGEDCDKCFNNYYFLNNNNRNCVHISDINEEEYYKYDENNYHLCSWLINNCHKCNQTDCHLCKTNYTLVNDDYRNCREEKNYQIGYYINEKGNMYYPCIDNCDICTNGTKCINCSNNYELFADGTSCGLCMGQELIVNDELTIENIDNLINTYMNNYYHTYDTAVLYTNPKLNYTLAIYRTWYCTDLLLKDKFYRVNTEKLTKKLTKALNKSDKSFVYAILNYNYKSFIQVYDIDLRRKIDIEKECPECIGLDYEIKNNYTSEINNLLGNVLSNVVYKYNINVLNSSDPYFHESCLNLQIQTIDTSIETRRSVFYLGEQLTKIACLDDDCVIDSVSYDNYIGSCNCKFNFDYQKLINNDKYYLNDYNQDKIFPSVSEVNPFPVLTCSKESFSDEKIGSNAGLYIVCIAILIQIVGLVAFLINYFARKKIVQQISSPPPKDTLTLKKKVIYTKDDEKRIQTKDKDIDEYLDNADPEKKRQARDEEEEEETDNNNSNNSRNNNANSKILTESFNTEINNENLSSRRGFEEFKFEKVNPDEAGNNFSDIKRSSTLSEIRKESSDEEKSSSKKSEKSLSKYSEKASSIHSKTTSNKSLDLSEDEIFTLAKSSMQFLELDYLDLEEVIEKDKRTITELYLHLLPLKQPIWDILSEIKALESNKSFVPLTLKIIRFIFMIILNMFFNSLFLTQNYFKKKYNHFNNKYNIQYNEDLEGISSNEKFSYALGSTIGFSISTFIICLILQFIINFFCFNLRKQVWEILYECENDIKEEIKKLNKFFDSKKKNFIIAICINFVLMIFFGFYLINFSQAFKGGVLDYVAGTLITWIFLQVIPFLSCIISALFRYYGIKNKNERLYKLNQVYIF